MKQRLNTSIRLSSDTKKRLLSLKERSTECFDDVINRIIQDNFYYKTKLGEKSIIKRR